MKCMMMHARTMARSDVFAQASLSRLGENSKTLPWLLLELSLRRRVLVLSEISSRSGERSSSKQELVGVWWVSLQLKLRRGTSPLGKEWSRSGKEGSSRRELTKSCSLSERPLSPERGSTVWARLVQEFALWLFFPCFWLLVVQLVGVPYWKYEVCEYAWDIWLYRLDLMSLVWICIWNMSGWLVVYWHEIGMHDNSMYGWWDMNMIWIRT